MASKSVFLDVDSSICEKNYLIAKNSEDAELNKMFESNVRLPPKIVKPSPGFCIKTKEVDTDKKVFINICKTDAIPVPKDITESELQDILNTDEICDFRVPMSIGDLHNEPDKKGEESVVCDIAIHPEFFEKIQRSELFKQFFIAVAFEGMHEKYKLSTVNEKIVLKNKLAMGTLQVHRIQQREIEQKMGLKESLPSFDQILNKPTDNKKLIEVIAADDVNTPEYRLFKKKDDEATLFAEVYLPYIVSAKDVSLDIGEDRIILESHKGKYFLDTFHNFSIDQSNTSSVFNKDSKFLTVTMPIKSC